MIKNKDKLRVFHTDLGPVTETTLMGVSKACDMSLDISLVPRVCSTHKNPSAAHLEMYTL